MPAATGGASTSSDRILVSLLESIVERAADVLEMVAADLNEVSNRLFIEDEEPSPTPQGKAGGGSSSRRSSNAWAART